MAARRRRGAVWRAASGRRAASRFKFRFDLNGCPQQTAALFTPQFASVAHQASRKLAEPARACKGALLREQKQITTLFLSICLNTSCETLETNLSSSLALLFQGPLGPRRESSVEALDARLLAQRHFAVAVQSRAHGHTRVINQRTHRCWTAFVADGGAATLQATSDTLVAHQTALQQQPCSCAAHSSWRPAPR